jgi:hypothetical protein
VTKRLVMHGFQIMPMLGILDDETDVVVPAPLQPTHIPPDGLMQFIGQWPDELARLRKDFAANQRDAEALANAMEAPPPRAARRANGAAKKNTKSSPARSRHR